MQSSPPTVLDNGFQEGVSHFCAGVKPATNPAGPPDSLVAPTQIQKLAEKNFKQLKTTGC